MKKSEILKKLDNQIRNQESWLSPWSTETDILAIEDLKKLRKEVSEIDEIDC